jgi:hypothetical protein
MKRGSIALLGVLVGLCGVLGAGCGREAMRPVSAERSPLLTAPASDAPPLAVLHAGDLVFADGAGGTLAWHGTLDGADASRDGALMQVRRAAGDPGAFAFAGDLGAGSVKVRTATALCTKMGGDRACAARLRRLRLGDGRLVAWEAAPTGACKLALFPDAAGDGTATTLDLEGLAEVRAATVDGHPVLLAREHWDHGNDWRGASMLVLRADGALRRALEIVTEEHDGRRVPLERSGDVTIEGGELVFRGTRRGIHPTTGAVLYAQPLVEKYRLAK